MLSRTVPALAAALLALPVLACGPYHLLEIAPAVDPVPAHDPIPGHDPVKPAIAPQIEVAILLDTSNSMDGLIDQARAKLWSIVNDLAGARKDGAAPRLRVALYEYGNSGLHPETGYIRQVTALTDDLDAVSAGLFSLSTNGGDEYCGAVIKRALDGLSWGEGDAYRAIFIAGNEPFSQGPQPYAISCKQAVTQGVVVNTIHCGPESEAREGGWVEAAVLGDGKSFTIDQGRVERAIDAPQDLRLRELNQELNGTYLGYGAKGRERVQLQAEQDANAAASSPSSFGQRAQAKASGAYRNATWDLCDAVEEGVVAVEELEEEALPAEMQGMTPAERTAHVAAKRAERAAIKAEIATLSEQREAYVAAERAKAGEDVDDTFGAAVGEALRAQLADQGFIPAK